MIFIEKNYVNKVVLTLTESSLLLDPFYLMVFNRVVNLDEVAPIYFTTPDLSNYPERFNLFEIEDSITGSTSGGTQIALNLPNGQYDYTIYESTGQTLSISATTGRILEEGRMVVGNFIQDLNNDLNNSPELGVYS